MPIHIIDTGTQSVSGDIIVTNGNVYIDTKKVSTENFTIAIAVALG